MPDIAVDRARCLGSGVCLVYAPNTFAHDEHARAFVTNAEGDPLDAIRSAIEGCPTSALSLQDEEDA